MGGILMLLPSLVLATSTSSSPKRDVSGKVVDLNKRHGIIVLEDYKGWDQQQMKRAREGAKGAIRQYLDRIGSKQAAIFLKISDVEKLKKGDNIRIAEYSFAMGSQRWSYVIPMYEKLEISPK
jgi:hypothetical protein